jgi:hypothetical protein
MLAVDRKGSIVDALYARANLTPDGKEGETQISQFAQRLAERQKNDSGLFRGGSIYGNSYC